MENAYIILLSVIAALAAIFAGLLLNTMLYLILGMLFPIITAFVVAILFKFD